MSKEFETEYISLCLKNAVWEEYNVEEKRGLLWVLEPTESLNLNVFSVSYAVIYSFSVKR